MTDSNERQAVIDGLGELATFLKEHPDAPVHSNVTITFFPCGNDDEAERAEVDRIAAILGVTSTANDRDTHYTAERSFGGVTYQAAAIRSDAMRRWDAERSYADAVQPDEAVSA